MSFPDIERIPAGVKGIPLLVCPTLEIGNSAVKIEIRHSATGILFTFKPLIVDSVRPAQTVVNDPVVLRRVHALDLLCPILPLERKELCGSLIDSIRRCSPDRRQGASEVLFVIANAVFGASRESSVIWFLKEDVGYYRRGFRLC